MTTQQWKDEICRILFEQFVISEPKKQIKWLDESDIISGIVIPDFGSTTKGFKPLERCYWDEGLLFRINTNYPSTCLKEIWIQDLKNFDNRIRVQP